MTDNFADIIEDCRVGQEDREQRELMRSRHGSSKNAGGAGACCRSPSQSSARRRCRRRGKAPEPGDCRAAQGRTCTGGGLDELADAYNPQRQLRARIEIANDAMQKALAAGAYDLAVKWEAWRNRALAMLGSG